MAGGVWSTQNKVRPGVYINFLSERKSLSSLGERGVAAFPAPLPWGKPGVTALDAASFADQSLAKIGYHADDARIRHIAAALAHASRVLIYRLGAQNAEKAAVTVGPLTATAKWGGLRGNDLAIIVRQGLDLPDSFEVITTLEGQEVDKQVVASADELAANDFVDWTGTGLLTITAGAALEGGTSGSAAGSEYADALAALESEEFNVLGIPVDDLPTKKLAAAFTKRLREEGKKIVAVVVNYPAADHEGVISLKNSIVTADGLQVEPIYLLWEIAAMEAAANMNQSLTYQTIPGAVDAYPRLTNAQTEQALLNGELVITASNGRAYIEQDINTFVSYTAEKGRMFSKNRVVRVLDGFANDVRRIFEQFYIGKVDNNPDGRALLQGEIVAYMRNLQEIAAIQNFDPQSDVRVLEGEQSDSIVIEVYLQPVDAVEKIYMKVRVR